MFRRRGRESTSGITFSSGGADLICCTASTHCQSRHKLSKVDTGTGGSGHELCERDAARGWKQRKENMGMRERRNEKKGKSTGKEEMRVM